MDRQTFCLSPLLRSAQLTVSTNLLAQALLFQSLNSFFSPLCRYFRWLRIPFHLPQSVTSLLPKALLFSLLLCSLFLFFDF